MCCVSAEVQGLKSGERIMTDRRPYPDEDGRLWREVEPGIFDGEKHAAPGDTVRWIESQRATLEDVGRKRKICD